MTFMSPIITLCNILEFYVSTTHLITNKMHLFNTLPIFNVICLLDTLNYKDLTVLSYILKFQQNYVSIISKFYNSIII